MPQVPAEYEPVAEFHKMAKAIQKKHPEIFADITVEKIRCVAIVNKERKPEKPLYMVKGVPMPIALDCPYSHYATIFLDDWAGMDEKHQLLLIAQILKSVPKKDDGGTDGKVLQPDLKDHSVLIRTFGTDYMTEDKVPNLLRDDVSWVIR